MTYKILMSLAAVSLAVASTAQAQSSRDYISVVGSSTVYPFTTAVAEQFGRAGQFKTPKVESTGTGGGIKLFCNGVGVQHPDIANASRRIKQTEVDTCAKNGVKDIVEIKVGYDGIVLAHSKKTANMKLTRRDVYLALAKQIPDPANPQNLIANPNKTWKDVSSSLPATKIEVLGPPPTSGTRDAFAELFMEAGCSTYPWIKTVKDVRRGPLQEDLPQRARRRRLRRSGRERQPHRAEARSEPGCARHLRLQLPRRERGQACRQPARRRLPGVRDDCLGQVLRFASALRLREEGAHRRHPGHQGIRRRNT